MVALSVSGSAKQALLRVAGRLLAAISPGGLLREVSRDVGQTLARSYDEGFRRAVAPSGRKWAPHARGRGGQIGVQSGALRASATVSVTDNSVKIASSAPSTRFFIRKRPIFPETNSLEYWRKPVTQTAEERLALLARVLR